MNIAAVLKLFPQDTFTFLKIIEVSKSFFV